MSYRLACVLAEPEIRWVEIVKILEWVHQFAAKRVSLPLYQKALNRQKIELQNAIIQFQSMEIEEEDQILWLKDLQPALQGLLNALEKALTEAEIYVQESNQDQMKRILLHLQEVERIEQYLQSRLGCANYLTQKEVNNLLSVASEKVATLLSME